MVAATTPPRDATQHQPATEKASAACMLRWPFRFRTLAARLMRGSASSDVVSAAQAGTLALRPRQTAVLVEAHMGDWFSGIGGASIYLAPPRKQRISPYYADVSLARDMRWHEMLQAYHAYFA